MSNPQLIVIDDSDEDELTPSHLDDLPSTHDSTDVAFHVRDAALHDFTNRIRHSGRSHLVDEVTEFVHTQIPLANVAESGSEPPLAHRDLDILCAGFQLINPSGSAQDMAADNPDVIADVLAISEEVISSAQDAGETFGLSTDDTSSLFASNTSRLNSGNSSLQDPGNSSHQTPGNASGMNLGNNSGQVPGNTSDLNLSARADAATRFNIDPRLREDFLDLALTTQTLSGLPMSDMVTPSGDHRSAPALHSLHHPPKNDRLPNQDYGTTADPEQPCIQVMANKMGIECTQDNLVRAGHWKEVVYVRTVVPPRYKKGVPSTAGYNRLKNAEAIKSLHTKFSHKVGKLKQECKLELIHGKYALDEFNARYPSDHVERIPISDVTLFQEKNSVFLVYDSADRHSRRLVRMAFMTYHPEMTYHCQESYTAERAEACDDSWNIFLGLLGFTAINKTLFADSRKILAARRQKSKERKQNENSSHLIGNSKRIDKSKGIPNSILFGKGKNKGKAVAKVQVKLPFHLASPPRGAQAGPARPPPVPQAGPSAFNSQTGPSVSKSQAGSSVSKSQAGLSLPPQAGPSSKPQAAFSQSQSGPSASKAQAISPPVPVSKPAPVSNPFVPVYSKIGVILAKHAIDIIKEEKASNQIVPLEDDKWDTVTELIDAVGIDLESTPAGRSPAVFLLTAIVDSERVRGNPFSQVYRNQIIDVPPTPLIMKWFRGFYPDMTLEMVLDKAKKSDLTPCGYIYGLMKKHPGYASAAKCWENGTMDVRMRKMNNASVASRRINGVNGMSGSEHSRRMGKIAREKRVAEGVQPSFMNHLRGGFSKSLARKGMTMDEYCAGMRAAKDEKYARLGLDFRDSQSLGGRNTVKKRREDGTMDIMLANLNASKRQKMADDPSIAARQSISYRASRYENDTPLNQVTRYANDSEPKQVLLKCTNGHTKVEIVDELTRFHKPTGQYVVPQLKCSGCGKSGTHWSPVDLPFGTGWVRSGLLRSRLPKKKKGRVVMDAMEEDEA